MCACPVLGDLATASGLVLPLDSLLSVEGPFADYVLLTVYNLLCPCADGKEITLESPFGDELPSKGFDAGVDTYQVRGCAHTGSH